MERREEIARLVDPVFWAYLDAHWAEASEDDWPGYVIGRREYTLQCADSILALDWTEPGLRRAQQIVGAVGEEHISAGVHDDFFRAIGKINAAIVSEINGGTDGLG